MNAPFSSSAGLSSAVAGNLGLIELYRTGGPLSDTLRSRNPAFWAVAGSALLLLLLLVVTQVPAIAPLFASRNPRGTCGS